MRKAKVLPVDFLWHAKGPYSVVLEPAKATEKE